MPQGIPINAFRMADKTVKPVEQDAERRLNNVIEDKYDEVIFLGKKRKIRNMKYGTLRKMTDTYLNDKDDWKVSAKCASLIILNGYWKIKLFHWAYWRWLFYVKQVDEEQITPLLELAKKKVQQGSYFVNTILESAIRDTAKTMTRAEVERFRAEQQSEG